MFSISQKKSLLLRIAAFIVMCYALCCALDYMFFDYSLDFIVFKWMISCTLMAFFVLLCVSLGYAGYVLFVLFCCLSFVLAYAYHIFGYELTYDGVVGIFQTNSKEISGFINPGLVCGLVVALLLPIGFLFICRKLLRIATPKVRVTVLLISLAGMCFMYNFPYIAYSVRPTVYLRTCSLPHKANSEFYLTGHYEVSHQHLCAPFVPLCRAFGYVYTYLTEKSEFDKAEDYESQCDAHISEDLVIVLVIGESVRADHCTFNGYERQTMGDVAKFPGVVPLPRMWSYGLSTYVSMQGIFSGLHVPGSSPSLTSFVGLFRKHGFFTHFMAENTFNAMSGMRLRNLVAYAFNRTEAFHGAIVEAADKLGKDIAAHSGSPYLLVVENGTGHFPYAVEESNRLFRPDKADYTKMNIDPQCVINDYDNCVYSVNLFLAGIIEHLKGRKAVLIYCSDHGQLLGESGAWTHGSSHEKVRHVGAFMWFSPEYEAACPEYVGELKAAAALPHCQGQLYATLLKLAGITTSAPIATEDLTHPAPDAAGVTLQPE